MEGIRYVAGLDPNSWLSVLLSGQYEVLLPHFMAVEILKLDPEKVEFRILEGKFRIGRRGDRYLHTGGFSLGCVTVTSTQKWDDIVIFLLRSRFDAKTVGTIEVVP